MMSKNDHLPNDVKSTSSRFSRRHMN